MDSTNKEKCSNFIKCLGNLVELGVFICICILCSLSSKNPFKSHVIGDVSNYFTININETQCICNDVILNHSCTDENILLGCKEPISEDNIKKI